jgi:hypothetical protein
MGAKSAAESGAVVIGGGPAGLMAAEVLQAGGALVDLYEAKPSVGRKFLVAGKGGLNLTNVEPFEDFLTRYGARRTQLEPILKDFGPAQLRAWLHELGFESFVGSSGRVFPHVMKAGPILHAWVTRLRAAGVRIHNRHTWRGWDESGNLRFATPEGEKRIAANALILALGGASWPQLGSTGAWVTWLTERGVPVIPFRPANCGFDVSWSEHFREHYAGQPIKTVILACADSLGKQFRQRGELVATADGVEGSLVYAAAALLRDEIERAGRAVITLDLAPDWSLARLSERLAQPRGARSLASHWRKAVGMSGVKAALLREFTPAADWGDPARLAEAIKSLAIPLNAARPLAEAISSAGGIPFEALDPHGMIRHLPGVFCAGEMLDWEAPTGGYLLTACFATGRHAALEALAWLGKV